MKSVFPDKDIFANYDLDIKKHTLEFMLEKYPSFVFGIDVGLVNKLDNQEYKYLVKNNLIGEFFTRMYYAIKEDTFDYNKLVEEYPNLVKTITMFKDLKKDFIKEYSHPNYKNISEDMAISLLVLAVTGEVNLNIFNRVEDD